MRNKTLNQIIFLIGIIGIAIAIYFQSVDTKLRINKDIYEMLGYLKIEECAITKLSIDVEKQCDDLSAEEIIRAIQNASDFMISNEQIVEYATNLGLSTASDYILYPNMTLDEYLTKYHGISSSDFFNQCYHQAKSEIEYFLTIGAIAEQRGIISSKEDVEAWCLQNGLNSVDLGEEELCYIDYYVIEQKVKESFE